MRVLLDECSAPVEADLPDHEVRSAQEKGGRLEERALLQAASGRFDVLLTVDRTSIPTEPPWSEMDTRHDSAR